MITNMTNKKLLQKLEEWGIDYEVLKHKTVYTAHDVAATLRKRLNEIAKTLIIQADKDFYLVSLPADKNVDFKKLKVAIKKAGGSVKSLSIPNEKVIMKKLGIKPGSVSAFSKFHKLPHIIDKDIKKVKKIVVSGGDVAESIALKLSDWLKVEAAMLEVIGQKKVKGQKSKVKAASKKSKKVIKKIRPKKSLKKKTVKRNTTKKVNKRMAKRRI